jgi:hypothetical protein
MKYVVSATAFLLLSFSFMLTGAMQVGRSFTYANPLIADGFAWCGDKPCFNRIVPGQTSWDEITHLIDVTIRSLSRMIGKAADLSVEAYHSPSSPSLHAPSSVTVSWIGQTVKDVTLHDFVLLYGQPCAVELWQGRNFMVIFPAMVVMAETVSGRVNLYSAVQAVTVVAPRGKNTCVFVSEQDRLWAGFQHLAHYRR